MKKYVSLIILPLFIIVMIGYFYIEVQSATKYYPRYQFEKISGNEAVVKDLVVTGEFSYDAFGFESFQVDSEGTTYYHDESFLRKNYYGYQEFKLESLINNYRNFMRGKAPFVQYFYETDEMVAYSSVLSDITGFDYTNFKIAVLDKSTKDVDEFTVPIPNVDDYYNVTVEQVYLDSNEIYIITINERMNNEGMTSAEDVHVYVFDFEKEEMVRHEIIGKVESFQTEQGYKIIEILKDESEENGSFVMFEIEGTYIDEFENHKYGETLKLNQGIKFNVLTNETEKLKVDDSIGEPLAMLGNEVFFANVGEKTLDISVYDTESLTIKNDLSIPTEESLKVQDLYNPRLENGKLYIVPSADEERLETDIFVIDLAKLETEYIGKVSLVEPLQIDNVSVYFNRIELRD